jgi:hypothetical protein
MNFNTIDATLAHGSRGGYICTPCIEGSVLFGDGNSNEAGDLNEALNFPFLAEGSNCYGNVNCLGNMIRYHQYNKLVFAKQTGPLGSDDLDFVCSKVGTNVEQRAENLSDKSLLSPFKIKLNLNLINLVTGKTSNIKIYYEAFRVKFGYWNEENAHWGLKYSLRSL